MPRPVLRTGVPRLSPSVGLRQTHRTRPSPICWATSATIFWRLPSASISSSTAKLISGRYPGGNSTSMTGPAMATTRPSACAFVLSTAVMSLLLLLGRFLDRREGVVLGAALVPAGLLAQGLGAADDLHDLGGDGILAGPVHDAAEGLDQLVGVVGGRLHGSLTGGLLGRRGLEHGGEHLGLQPARHEAIEDVLGLGLELVHRPLRRRALPGGQLVGDERHQLTG